MSRHFRASRALLAAVAALSLAACAGTGKAPPAAWPEKAVSEPAKAGFSAAGLAALDAAMAKSVANGDVAGMVTLLSRDGQVVQFNSYGVQSGDPKTGTPMANDTLFRIYSMSKPITGVAMMMLYEEGKWDLDDPVTKHAPELAGLKVLKGQNADGTPILEDMKRPPTMRELMSHTAGFGYGLSGQDFVNQAFRDRNVLTSANLDEMMAKIAAIPLLSQPGERWYYSAAVDIQGYLVQKLSGQRFSQFLDSRLFTPLGMNDTTFVVTPEMKPRFADVYGWDKDLNALAVRPERTDRSSYYDPGRIESGGGGLVSTTHDYARFCQFMLNRGKWGGKRLLKPETVDLMATNHIGDLRLYSDGTTANPGLPGVGFGLDFAVYGDAAAAGLPAAATGAYYWGGAAGTWFWIDPNNQLFFIGMIQRMGGARPGSMDFRKESMQLVYAAMAPK